MTSCQRLANSYANRAEGQPLPSADADDQVRQNWFYRAQWGCLDPQGQFRPDTNPTGQFPQTGYCYENYDPPAANPNSTTNVSGVFRRPPPLNKLQEEGFLAWVNERGRQCINKITGKFYGLDPNTGLVKEPDQNTPPPPVNCAGICLTATTDSDQCFQCIASVLEKDPTQCPALAAEKEFTVTDMLKESLGCMECIGDRSVKYSDNEAENRKQSLDQVWNCLTGNVSAPLSTDAILAIVLVSVLVVTVLVALAVYFWGIQPRLQRKQAEQAKLRAQGIDPENL